MYEEQQPDKYLQYDACNRGVSEYVCNADVKLEIAIALPSRIQPVPQLMVIILNVDVKSLPVVIRVNHAAQLSNAPETR